MRFGALEFKPGLWPTVVTLLLLVMLLTLGFWQLDRAQQKRELLTRYDGPRDAPLLQLDPEQSAHDAYEEFAYQLASAAGEYDTDHQFLLDNRTYRGQVGYHVLTPLRLRGSDAAVLVNRGWVALAGGRSTLPDPGAQAGPRTVLGRFKLPVRNSFMLGEEQPRRGWPYRIQRVDTERLAGELGYPLLPVVLLLEPEQPDGFVRDWQPLSSGPERNIGYAVQWFGLAAALLVIYAVVNTKTLDS